MACLRHLGWREHLHSSYAVGMKNARWLQAHDQNSGLPHADTHHRAPHAPFFSGLCLALLVPIAQAWADTDGHGPDAWRVVDVPQAQELEARMGPGSEYLVIDRFAAGERGLQQVTCVPYLNLGQYMELSESQREALPPRWCLMRSADYSRSGWVEGRFLAEDSAVMEPGEGSEPAPQVQPTPPSSRVLDGLQTMKARLQRLGDWMLDRLRPDSADKPASPQHWQVT